MKKENFIRQENEISAEEMFNMLIAINDVLFQIENFNNFLLEKIRERHPMLGQFLRAVIISNCNAVSSTIKIRHILEKTLDSYLDKSDDNSSAHS